MSHVHYAFQGMKDNRIQERLRLRNVASAKYGGDWHSIPHSHGYTELFYIVGGDGQFQIDDTCFPVQAHQMVIVNPNIMHTEVSYEAHALEYIVMGIEGMEMTMPESDENRYCIYTFPPDNDVLACMRGILREMQTREKEYLRVCQACMEIILVQLMRNISVSVTQKVTHSANNRQSAAIRHYIDQHYKEKLTLEQLAEEVNVNKYYLAHAFKQEYGISPINYLIACRIREGKRLLTETDLSLSQIAGILGFSSASYFSQSFRKAEGISPVEYRKLNVQK